MPSTFTHYRFAQEVLKTLPNSAADIINAAPELYYTGAHGPDILFYYKGLKRNPVNTQGLDMHNFPAEPFFLSAKKTISESWRPEAALAYILGFITHFALDSSCHPYVYGRIEESGISHSEIEVEFDRELMEKQGLDPVRYDPTSHIKPNPALAEVIAPFFSLPPETVEKSLRYMKKYNRLLVAPCFLKRAGICLILKISGNYKDYRGLMVNYKPNPRCRESNDELMRLLNQSIPLAARLITEYAAEFDKDVPLDPVYKKTYE